MNENIDLTKILKDVPNGTKLYSPLFGVVEFIKVSVAEGEYPIITSEGDFVADGRYYEEHKKGECLLFPSKDQRDWSKFEMPTNKKVKVTLHPFDRVLVRDNVYNDWRVDILSHIIEDKYPYVGIGNAWRCCLPYTSETAHLIGTTDTPSVEYEIEYDKSFSDAKL